MKMKGKEADGWLHQEIIKLSQKEKMEEFMFLGLRMIKGVSRKDFLRRFGVDMWDIYGKVLEKLKQNRLITVDDFDVKLTEFGIDISNYVLSEFLL